jgi:hypothetical protein
MQSSRLIGYLMKIIKQDPYNLYSHPFISLVVNEAATIIKERAGKRLKVKQIVDNGRKSNSNNLLVQERYCITVFYRIANFFHVYSRLRRARYLLIRAPIGLKSKSYPLTKNEWTDYNFYVYTTSLASIVDCLLLIISHVYSLNIPYKKCRTKNILEHPRIKNSNVHRAFSVLLNRLDKYTQNRHRYLHRGDESSLEDYSSSGRITSIRNISFLHDQGLSRLPDSAMRLLWKLRLDKINSKLDRDEEVIFRSVSNVLRLLRRDYRKLYEAYKSKKIIHK